ncbi:hypothetical protein CPLU01_14032 [Colletotrichum plurivorum]|uniref:Uncharacterized protein n=1 Tax=Colletotrichum plurivorum TaxID=2175906 RepID=A0A8H6JMT9_9PEZI|nr:hypothetical protein CPLU01_14032 [Colletotrichum plurivorum]
MSNDGRQLATKLSKETEQLSLLNDESESDSVGHVNYHHGESSGRKRAWPTTKLRWLAITTALITAFILGRVSNQLEGVADKATRSSPVSLGKCSPDWREAKAQGCVYDFVLSTWMHPRCFNETMHERYKDIMRWKNLTFWREPSMEHEVSFEVAASGEHEGFLWTQGSEHHLHCSYVWERIRDASRRNPLVLDSLCRDEKHVDHCIFYNGVPFGWEVDAPNVTRIYNEPYLVDCVVG